MQLVVLILVAVVLLEDRSQSGTVVRPWWAVLAFSLPAIIVLLLQSNAMRRAMRRLDARDPRGFEDVDRCDRWMRVVPWAALLGLSIAILGFGWLESIRRLIGDLPAIDELLALLPAFVAMAASWWLHEPIERRVREASLIRRLDEGLPIAPLMSRARFVFARLRTNVLLMLVPVMMVLASSEITEWFVRPRWPTWWSGGGRELATLGIAACVYFISPWIARLVLDLETLPPGELRDDLVAVCDGCGVRVRDILLWHTDYGMVNGAVMGLVAPVRYVMLTDGLLELLPRDELRAVMAHEIGHVRRRHLPWMLGVLVVLLAVVSMALDLPMQRIFDRLKESSLSDSQFVVAVTWLDRGGALVAGAISLIAFGWVSRRFERQADAFAVQFLSRVTGVRTVTPGAVLAMAGALGSVARHAGVNARRFSWRHGSIDWRQRYLETLVGRRVDALGIDRLIAALKLAVVIGIVAIAAVFTIESFSQPTAGDVRASARGSVRMPQCAS